MPPSPTARAKASQELIPIEEIRNGIVILKDKSLRVVIMASSLNFALKSGTEQDAIILQYQNFLNSLDFSIQFFIQSRKLNIEPYLDTLRERVKQETNELMKLQTSEYITFVKEFVESSNIVSKTFYVVIPFIPGTVSFQKPSDISTTIGGLFGGRSKKEERIFEEEKFEEYRLQLLQRASVVIDGLARCGVRSVPLNTEEFIELYYGLYNQESVGKGGAPEFVARQGEQEK